MKMDLQMFCEGAEGGEMSQTEAVAEQGTEEVTAASPEVQEKSQAVQEGSGEAEKPPMSDLDILRAVRDALEEREKNIRIESIIKSWENQAQELKSTYPEFDLSTQVQNPEFALLLKAGLPLRKAFEAANLENIISAAVRYATVLAGQKAVEGLMKTKERPRENGVLDRASSIRHTDVHSLSQQDIMRILGEVSRGAKISFS